MTTNTTYTPGPWKVTRERGIEVTNEEGTVGIASCRSCFPESCIELDEDDARLIAAAPELLECLKAMRDADEKSEELFARAEAIIARAEGK